MVTESQTPFTPSESRTITGLKLHQKLGRALILLEVNKPFYKARGVDVDDVLLPKIPERYAICRFRNQAMHQISLLEACSNLDNVFLIPTEKLDSLKDSCNGISWN